MSNISIIMYHYVRDLKASRYPEIKGLDLSIFKDQIRFLCANYSLISIEDVIETFYSHKKLPENAALLTFDDGYIDHFESVFPLLRKKNIKGAFYAPVQAVTENIVLDVNKIHFILAAVENKQQIIKDIFKELDVLRKDYALESNEYYWEELAHPNRFDSAEVIFIKRILQVALPKDMRNRITDHLFTTYLDTDEETFSKSLYLNRDQLQAMHDDGMHIGVHGYRHEWLSALDSKEQEIEVKRSLQFLESIGVDKNTWTICYPYGDFNDSLLSILNAQGVKLGMTTEVSIADTSRDFPLTLPRIDTNDITRLM